MVFGLTRLELEPIRRYRKETRGHRGHGRMVVRFTITCGIITLHQYSYEFELRSWRCILDTTLCDKLWQWLAKSRWFSPGTSVSSTNKTDRHDITKLLLKVAFNTITLTNYFFLSLPNCLSYQLCEVRYDFRMCLYPQFFVIFLISVFVYVAWCPYE